MSSKTKRNSIKFNNSDYVINSCKPLALCVGLWPINYKHSQIRKIISIILNIIAILLILQRFLFTVIFSTFVLKSITLRIAISAPACYHICNLIKYIVILFRIEKIEKCLKIMKEDWRYIENNEQHEVMINNAKTGRYIIFICTSIIFLSGLGYNILAPLLSHSIVTHRNITVKPFPSPVYGKFFTSGQSPIYEIIFAVQLVTAFFLYSVTAVAISYIAILTMHACSQFDIVMIYLNKLIDIQDKEKTVHKKFVIIVNTHHRVVR